MFETEVFPKQMCCTEGSTCDIVGTFGAHRSHAGSPAVIWRPHNDSAPGELHPLALLRYAPDTTRQAKRACAKTFQNSFCVVHSRFHEKHVI